MCTNLGLLQNVCQRRQAIFNRLLAAFGALQKQVTKLTRDKEVQQTRISELEGEFLLASTVRLLPR